MKKTIRPNLRVDGAEIATLDDLRDHITTELIPHVRAGRLAGWLRPRDMADELEAVEKMMAHDSQQDLPDAVILRELCRIFGAQIRTGRRSETTAKARVRWANDGDMIRDFPQGPELVVIPAGSFTMGTLTEEDGYANEQPQHDVNIGYRLAVGVYTVTFDEWEACLSAGGCGGYLPDDEGWGRGRRPVINVSWHDAHMYLRWLSWKTGKGYRLLSESEWEYVARAGTTTRYWWGDQVGRNQACCDGCGSHWDNNRTAPVGSFSANAFGLYDVHGNIHEWVQDVYYEVYRDRPFFYNISKYPYTRISRRSAPEDGSAWELFDRTHYRPGTLQGPRLVRGGSWDSPPSDLRSARRCETFPTDQGRDVGFRVARTLDVP